MVKEGFACLSRIDGIKLMTQKILDVGFSNESIQRLKRCFLIFHWTVCAADQIINQKRDLDKASVSCCQSVSRNHTWYADRRRLKPRDELGASASIWLSNRALGHLHWYEVCIDIIKVSGFCKSAGDDVFRNSSSLSESRFIKRMRSSRMMAANSLSRASFFSQASRWRWSQRCFNINFLTFFDEMPSYSLAFGKFREQGSFCVCPI